MSVKMSEKSIQNKMDEHLSNTRLDIKAVLQRFEDMGVKIDRRFQRDFIKQTTDCVIDACERFCSRKRNKTSRKDKCIEATKKDDKKRQQSNESRISKDIINDGESVKQLNQISPVKRTLEEEPTADRDDCKRRKSSDVTDSCVTIDVQKCETLKIDLKPDQPVLFFYCAHCLDANESGESIGGSIDDVYKHWQTSHIINLPSKSFLFSVAPIGVCQFGDAIGTYRELLKHQHHSHPNESLAIVSVDDRKKCGICLKPSDSMIEHFEIEHKTLSRTEVFNPMRMSDGQLDHLLSIEVHKKRQCGHCDAVFETDNEIDIHHEIGHEQLEKISKPYVDSRSPYLVCAYCQVAVDRDEYLIHVKSHPYVFKCWKCTYQTKALVDLVFHDKQMHERDTLDYHCAMFSEWIKSHFEKTKMIFPNGLVLRNYNLFGTTFDDSKLFGVFVDGLVALVKNKFELLNNANGAYEMNELQEPTDVNQSTPTSATPDDSAFYLSELIKQNELANNLLILKMPRMNMDPSEMFLKLCHKLHINVSMDDIQQSCRRNDDIIVTLKSYELKEEIRYSASMHRIESADLFELQPDQWNKKIKVISHTTRYYSDMLSISREARKDRLISHYELTKQGIQIKRSPSSDDRIFISKAELANFIQRIKRDK